MKPALHRSITFWAGVLVMAFLCWAWRESMHPRTPTDLSRPPGRVGNYQGGLCIDYRCPYMAQDFGMGRAVPWRWQAELLPKPFFRKYGSWSRAELASIEQRIYSGKAFTREEWMLQALDGAVDGAWRLFIPHWLLLLAVALPWSALLLWRARRHKRTIAP